MIDDDTLKQLLRINDGLIQLCKQLTDKRDMETGAGQDKPHFSMTMTTGRSLISWPRSIGCGELKSLPTAYPYAVVALCVDTRFTGRFFQVVAHRPSIKFHQAQSWTQ